MTTYSQSWVLPQELLVTLLFIFVLVLNVRRSNVRLGAIMVALPAALAILLSVPVAMVAAQFLVSQVLAGRAILSDSSANSWLLVGLLLLGTCMGGFLFSLFRKRLNPLAISFAGLLLVDILSWAIALVLPAASYLLFWPLLLATLGLLAITLSNKVAHPGLQCLAALPGAAVAIIIFAPIIYLLYIFLALQLIAVAAIGLLLGLFCTIAVPHLNIAIPRGRWHLPALLVCAAAALGIGVGMSHSSAQHPRRDSVVYSMNADSHTAAWISYDKSLDPWVKQFFSSKPESRPLPDYLTGWPAPVLSVPASPLDFPPPVATIKADENNGGTRSIKLNIRSQRNSAFLRLVLADDVQLVSAGIGARRFSPVQLSKPSTIFVLGMDINGADLELVVKAPGKVSFWLSDQSSGLPLTTKPRPDDIMPGGASDVTYICRKYSI